MHYEYDYSFIAFIFGHNKGYKSELIQSDMVLLSIANNNHEYDVWECISCLDSRYIQTYNANVNNNKKQSIKHTEEITQYYQRFIDKDNDKGKKGIIGKVLELFKKDETTKSEHNNPNNGEPFYVSTNQKNRCRIGNKRLIEDDVESAFINSTNNKPIIRDMLFAKYCISNPPKSGINGIVYSFGIKHTKEKYDMRDICIYMRIHTYTSVPGKSNKHEPRNTIFNNLVDRMINREYTPEYIINTYNYYYDTLNSFYTDNVDENSITNTINEIEILHKENNHHKTDMRAPIIMLLDLSKYKGCLGLICKTIIHNISERDRCFKSLYVQLDMLRNKIEYEQSIPKPNEVRMLMRELSTFCTRYSDRTTAYLCVCLSMLIRDMVEGV